VVGRQNADIADISYLRSIAMATSFWLLIGYNFSCVIASGTIYYSGGGFLGSSYPEYIADFEVQKTLPWRIQLNHPCAAVMQPYVKLL